MSIQERQDNLVNEFQALPGWEERYKLLIAKGKALPPLPTQVQDDKYKVKGCQSSVWMHAELKDGKIYYVGDSDAAIVKGLIALLLEIYSDLSPAEIMQSQPEFIQKIGIDTNLSASRTNGLSSMIKQIKLYAFALQQMN